MCRRPSRSGIEEAEVVPGRLQSAAVTFQRHRHPNGCSSIRERRCPTYNGHKQPRKRSFELEIAECGKPKQQLALRFASRCGGRDVSRNPAENFFDGLAVLEARYAATGNLPPRGEVGERAAHLGQPEPQRRGDLGVAYLAMFLDVLEDRGRVHGAGLFFNAGAVLRRRGPDPRYGGR